MHSITIIYVDPAVKAQYKICTKCPVENVPMITWFNEKYIRAAGLAARHRCKGSNTWKLRHVHTIRYRSDYFAWALAEAIGGTSTKTSNAIKSFMSHYTTNSVEDSISYRKDFILEGVLMWSPFAISELFFRMPDEMWNTEAMRRVTACTSVHTVITGCNLRCRVRVFESLMRILTAQ